MHKEKMDKQEEEEIREVSLNTFSNANNLRIFQILAKHGAQTIEVLIDIGSNNNFIQEALVEKLGLKCTLTKKI